MPKHMENISTTLFSRWQHTVYESDGAFMVNSGMACEKVISATVIILKMEGPDGAAA